MTFFFIFSYILLTDQLDRLELHLFESSCRGNDSILFDEKVTFLFEKLSRACMRFEWHLQIFIYFVTLGCVEPSISWWIGCRFVVSYIRIIVSFWGYHHSRVNEKSFVDWLASESKEMVCRTRIHADLCVRSFAIWNSFFFVGTDLFFTAVIWNCFIHARILWSNYSPI